MLQDWDWPLLCGSQCVHNFLTPTHFRFNPRKLLTLTHCCIPVYTGATWNYFVYTAGTSSSVEGQYATAYIYYFVASYLFLFNHSWSLWRCFVLLSEGLFPFLCHVRVFPFEVLLVCLFKYPYNCFSSHFCFPLIFVLLMLVFSVLFLVAVISLSPHFLFSLWVAVSMHQRFLQCWKVHFILISFTSLGCKCLHILISFTSLGCKCLHIVISFLVVWSIHLTFSLIYFKNDPKYLISRTVLVFIPLMRFLQHTLLSRCFLVLKRYSFLIFFLSSPLVWCSPLPIFPSTCYYLYHFYLLIVFHSSTSRWFLTGVWVPASQLKSPGFSSVF